MSFAPGTRMNGQGAPAASTTPQRVPPTAAGAAGTTASRAPVNKNRAARAAVGAARTAGAATASSSVVCRPVHVLHLGPAQAGGSNPPAGPVPRVAAVLAADDVRIEQSFIPSGTVPAAGPAGAGARRRLPRRGGQPLAVGRLARALARNRPDIVHVHLGAGGAACGERAIRAECLGAGALVRTAEVFRVPAVVHLHDERVLTWLASAPAGERAIAGTSLRRDATRWIVPEAALRDRLIERLRVSAAAVHLIPGPAGDAPAGGHDQLIQVWFEAIAPVRRWDDAPPGN